MNVYDFDETIFTGDSENRFIDFISKKPGFARWKYVWKFYNFLFKANLISKTASRQRQYAFLKNIKDIDRTLEEYWDEVWQYMKPWYSGVKQDDDVIASGTPAFLLEPAMRRLGLTNLVATDMDKRTGKINGDFAIRQYKLECFRQQFSVDDIDKFYSDDYADNYLAQYAKEAFAVRDGGIHPWNEYFEAHPEHKRKQLQF